MKVIMISRDPKVLEAGGAAYLRMQEYKQLFDELHIIVLKGNSFSFIKTFFVASKQAWKVGKGNWISSQDPFESGIIALLVAKVFGLKLQFQLHTEIFGHFYSRLSIANFLRALLARSIISRADSIRVVSQRIKDQILERKLAKADKIFVLPVFVDVHSITSRAATYSLKQKYPEFEKIILVVARLEKEKNLPLAFEAFRKILRKLSKAGLVIQGDGSQHKRLLQLAERLNIQNSVRFEGWAQDTASAYKSADLLLVTSFYEGYGMSIIEALSCGCAVVSTDVGIAREAGAEVANYDAGEIALKCVSILVGSKRGDLIEAFSSDNKQEYLNKYRQTFL